MDIAYNKVDQTALPIDTTRVSASEYNQIAGSLMSIISASGLTPDSADNTQLLNALKAMSSGWAMPSSVYDNLTLGASGTDYQAPADGYFDVFKSTNANNQYFTLTNASAGQMTSHAWCPSSGGGCACFMLAKKGDTVHVTYTAGGTLNYFRFIYAEGSKSAQEES